MPYKLAPSTATPPAVEAVCVPCPSISTGVPSGALRPRSKYCAPITLLRRFKPVKFPPMAHVPFHLRGGGPIPVSLKLGDSDHIPAAIETIFEADEDRFKN